ncbi:hypothetical protein [Haloterrigena salina]|uniref:hypothetical protein n=1 Tax=Haloterrigena salina TaxID=504937 RepID=UPI00126856F8|nr:hypothetical protein [Haloterrigena salina]
MDPDKYAVAISRVSDNGIGAISDLGFYGTTPIYHLFHTVVMDISGLGPATTLQITSTIFFALVPVVIVSYLAAMLSGDRAAKLGCILASAGAASIIYATLTIPQGLMLLLWYLVAVILIVDRHHKMSSALLVILIALMASLHKIGAILALGGVVGVAVVNFINAMRDNRVLLPRYLYRYAIIAGLIFMVQMIWLTTWIKAITLKLTYIITGASIDTTIEAPAATKIGGLNYLFFEHSSWILLLFAAGVSGVWLLYTRRDRQTAGLLGISGLAALIICFAVATPFSLSIQRAIGIGEPFLIILAVIGAISLSKRTDKSIAPIVIGILIITQLIGAGVVPDHPTEVNEHLTDEEIEAKDWANKHLDQRIYGHYFVAQEITDFEGERATYKTGAGGGFPSGWSPASKYLVSGNLSEADGCFFLRKGQDRVRYNGLYRLKYDPITRLNESSRALVFENTDVVIYC